MKFKDTLPIGSVVRIKGVGKPVMIFGYEQQSRAFPERVSDYIGVVYPEGHIDSRLHLGFNMDDIEEICFRGYESEERQIFIETIDRFKDDIEKIEGTQSE